MAGGRRDAALAARGAARASHRCRSWLVERAAATRHADVEAAMPLDMILAVWESAELAGRQAIDAASFVAAAADSVAAARAEG
eukprot:580168-Prymnesium_polylepis.1